MAQTAQRRMALMAVVCGFAIVSGWSSDAQSVPNDTFTITISLLAPTIHVGEVPVIEDITENKTNHLVYAGWADGGPVVELIDEKGEDISLHVLGNERNDNDIYLRPPIERLEPGYHNRGPWSIRTELGPMTPGIYKLRIHRLGFKNGDIKAGAEVYSNTLTLTVIPCPVPR
jgi:hypothetical protein